MNARTIRVRPTASGTLAALLTVCACGSAPTAPSVQGAPAGQPIPITGHEQIGWSQSTPSAQDLSTYRYAIYVDDHRVDFANATCSPVDGTAAACHGPLPALTPGPHNLQIAAFVQTGNSIAESPRSPVVAVLVSPAPPG